MPRPKVMQQMLSGPNIGFSVARSVRGSKWRDILATTTVTEFGVISTRPGNSSPLFPLYIYEKKGDNLIKKSNLTKKAISKVSSFLGLRFIENDKIDPNTSFNSKSLFHYIYALLHSNNYRERYAEFLKNDFPFILFPKDPKIWRNLITIGADLVALHTLQESYPQASWNKNKVRSPFVSSLIEFRKGKNDSTVGKISKSCYQDEKIYIDTQSIPKSSFFTPIPLDAWNFKIGSYQICYKWLYDRRKRKNISRILTENEIMTYKNIICSISETNNLVKEIDEILGDFKRFNFSKKF
jgi:predicted helicase